MNVRYLDFYVLEKKEKIIGKDPRIKSEDDILNLLDSSEYRIDVGKGVV